MSSKVIIPMMSNKLRLLYIAAGPKRMDARWKFGEKPVCPNDALCRRRRAS